MCAPRAGVSNAPRLARVGRRVAMDLPLSVRPLSPSSFEPTDRRFGVLMLLLSPGLDASTQPRRKTSTSKLDASTSKLDASMLCMGAGMICHIKNEASTPRCTQRTLDVRSTQARRTGFAFRFRY